jgi:hypothetical protein
MEPRTKKMHLAAAGVLAIATAGLAGTALAGGGAVHLRVVVTDTRTGEERVKMNLPLDAVDAILDSAGAEMGSEWGDLQAHTHGVDIRKLYLSLRDQDLSDFLEVNDEGGERVKVWKDQQAFRVNVWEDARTEPKVRVQLPLAVMDALFAGPEGAPPDLRAAVAKLREFAPLELVQVSDDGETVRIWIE